jgi:fumarylacetoacetate (FAA) hydrolase
VGQRVECVPAVAAVTDDVPSDVAAAGAASHVRLLALLVDHAPVGAAAPPTTTCAPVVVTPDELGDAWHDQRIHASVACRSGDDEAVECVGTGAVDFATFVIRAARGRGLVAGTLLSVAVPPSRAVRASAGGRIRVEWQVAPGPQVFGAIDRV